MRSNAFTLSQLLISQRSVFVRMVKQIVGSRPEAEDVVQGLWIKLQGVEDDRSIENPQPYLVRLALNSAKTHKMRLKRHDQAKQDAQDLLHGSRESFSPERVTIGREDIEHMDNVIRALPERTRYILYLNRIQGVPQQRIAVELGISTTSVERHMRRALDIIALSRDAGPS
ncbi:MAG: sigma-70 family RNA polymerase sigma factor [Acetobacter fabarum]|uniref:sigma-70 family RNA polymerase sigma factor n=1 Tax=Acetobacter fabarum TaxID=483199 RepID=UPI0039EC5891